MKSKGENTSLNKDKIIVIYAVVLSLFVITLIGFAYFSSPLSNSNNEKYSLETASISLKFDDNDNGVSEALTLGETITKKFTLENTGTKDAYAKINWVDLINTYTSESLSFSLEQSTSENGTYTSIKAGNVPTSSEKTTTTLKDGILVPVNTKYYYNLVITLNNLDTNQNSDINALLNTKFGLEEGVKEVTAVEHIQNLARGANPNSTEEFIGPSIDNMYVIKFSGKVNNGYQYNFAEICQDTLDSWFSREYGTNINGTCALDSSTNKYDLILTGDSRNSINHIYENLSDCKSALEVDNYLNTTCEQVPVTCNTFAYDGTSDNNLRYVGANPCNHVNIDGYMARIIGIMNNVDNGTGNEESRLKVIFLREFWDFPWGNSSTNNFNNSIVKNSNELIGWGIPREECISEDIGNAKVYLRSFPDTENNISAGSLYAIEKNEGSVYPGNPTDAITDMTMLNPSDLFEAVGGNMRNECLSKNVIGNYNNPSDYQKDCTNYNWFTKSNNNYYTDQTWTSVAVSNNNTNVYYFDQGNLISTNPREELYGHVVAYLKPNVKILSGIGIYNDPYIIGTKNCTD